MPHFTQDIRNNEGSSYPWNVRKLTRTAADWGGGYL